MGVSKNRGGPPNHPMFNRVFHYKPSLFRVPWFFGNTHVYMPSTNEGWKTFSFLVKRTGPWNQGTSENFRGSTSSASRDRHMAHMAASNRRLAKNRHVCSKREKSHLHPRKLTCPLKINGWFRCISYWPDPFLGDMLVFGEGMGLQNCYAVWFEFVLFDLIWILLNTFWKSPMDHSYSALIG